MARKRQGEMQYNLLPKNILGLDKIYTKDMEEDGVILHMYGNEQVTVYFFYYKDVKDLSWQAGIEWASDKETRYTSCYPKWSIAYKALRDIVNERSELNFIVNVAQPGQLSAEQIVTLLLCE